MNIRKECLYVAADYRKLAKTVSVWTWHETALQSVPGTSSGNRKSSIVVGWQPCTADREWWRRRWSEAGSNPEVRGERDKAGVSSPRPGNQSDLLVGRSLRRFHDL